MMHMQSNQAPQPCASLPTFTPLAMPLPTMPALTQEPLPNDLLNYLQKRSVDLPLDVQKRVQTESRKQGKRVIKDLQVAAKSL
jgi:hypothetical protein